MSNPFGESRSLDIEGLHVFLAMPSHRDLHPYTVASLLQTQAEFFERGVPLDVRVVYGNSLPHHARTHIAWQFLQTKANRLFWVDSDMIWEPKDFVRLVALSTVMDMVAGAYVAKQDKPLFMVSADLKNLQGNEYGCIAMDGLGMGFSCMKREVVEAVAANAPKMGFHNIGKEPVPHIFRFGDDGDGNAQGEDMAFFEDARKLGFELWVDPTVTLGHVGPKVYRASLMDHLKKED